MPIDVDRPNPKIKVLFQGFVITRIKDGVSPAKLGALGTSDCHKPKISVLRITEDRQMHAVENLVFDINEDIWLDVENTGLTTVQEYIRGNDNNVRDFDRKADVGDKNDFRWFIDLDTLFEGDAPTVSFDKLKPVFHIDKALFYTESRTIGKMKIKRGNNQPELFGRTAEQIAANIYFDRDDSKAVLRNGDKTVFTFDAAEKGTTFIILFNCECHEEIVQSDFPLIHEVIGGNLPSDKKLDLIGEDLRPQFANTPEVPCFGGNIRN